MSSATMTSEEVRTRLSDVLNRALYRNERTLITRHGRNIAAVISMEELELLDELIRKAEDRIDARGAREAIAEMKEKGTIPFEQLEKELGL